MMDRRFCSVAMTGRPRRGVRPADPGDAGRKRHFLFLPLAACLIFLFIAASARAGEDPERLAQRVKPSVVVIFGTPHSSTKGKAPREDFAGTGFIVHEAGRVVTNRHVLVGLSRGRVRLYDGRVFPITRVLAVDEDYDLVMVEVDLKGSPKKGKGKSGAASKKRLKPVTVSPDLPEMGEQVVVVGHPGGQAYKVSQGKVSAIKSRRKNGREIQVIQSTVPTAPGGSGSPVFNLKGQVVGVTTMRNPRKHDYQVAMPGVRVRALKPAMNLPLSQWGAQTAAERPKVQESIKSGGRRKPASGS